MERTRYMINTFKIKRRRQILDKYFQNNGEKKNTRWILSKWWGEEKFLVLPGSPCSLPVELVLASSSMGLQSPYIIIQVAGHHHHHHHHSIGIIITIILFFPPHQFLKARAIISIFIEPIDEQHHGHYHQNNQHQNHHNCSSQTFLCRPEMSTVVRFLVGYNCSWVIPHRTEPVQCKPKYGWQPSGTTSTQHHPLPLVIKAFLKE